jgi:hypothetical protein
LIEEDGHEHLKNSPCEKNRMYVISYRFKKSAFSMYKCKRNLANGDDEIQEILDVLIQHINNAYDIENIDDCCNDLYDDTKQIHHAIYLFY